MKKFLRAERGARIWGYFVWKIKIFMQKITFFPILGGCRLSKAQSRICNESLLDKAYCIYWSIEFRTFFFLFLWKGGCDRTQRPSHIPTAMECVPQFLYFCILWKFFVFMSIFPFVVVLCTPFDYHDRELVLALTGCFVIKGWVLWSQ